MVVDGEGASADFDFIMAFWGFEPSGHKLTSQTFRPQFTANSLLKKILNM